MRGKGSAAENDKEKRQKDKVNGMLRVSAFWSVPLTDSGREEWAIRKHCLFFAKAFPRGADYYDFRLRERWSPCPLWTPLPLNRSKIMSA